MKLGSERELSEFLIRSVLQVSPNRVHWGNDHLKQLLTAAAPSLDPAVAGLLSNEIAKERYWYVCASVLRLVCGLHIPIEEYDAFVPTRAFYMTSMSEKMPTLEEATEDARAQAESIGLRPADNVVQLASKARGQR